MTKFSNAIYYLASYGEVHRQNEIATAAGAPDASAGHKLAQAELREAIALLQQYDGPRAAGFADARGALKEEHEH